MIKKILSLTITALSIVSFSHSAIAQDEPVFESQPVIQEQPAAPDPEFTPKHQTHGLIDLNYYPYDTRDYSVFTVNLAASLPNRFSYFSFVNYTTAIGSNKNQDLEDFYTEQNLTWNLPGKLPFDLIAQWVIGTGLNNDLIRFGAGVNASAIPFVSSLFKDFGIFYIVHFFPMQVDSLSGYNCQIEHFYNFMILPATLRERVYVYGFLDQNFGPGGHPTVHEHNLGIRLIERFHSVAEYRHNAFLPKQDGFGFGLEYKINL